MRELSITAPWGVSVIGIARREAVPDVARVRVAVREIRAEPSEAFEVTRGVLARVRASLRDHGVPEEAVSTSRLNLESTYDYDEGGGDGRRLRGYRCAASLVVEVRDLDGLESLLTDVVGAGANHVDGVTFDVSTRAALRAEARDAAVASAREKAERYAAAAGVRLGRVLHIEDLDTEGAEVGGRYVTVGGVPESGGRELAPGAITVATGVLLGFALETD
ncbi:SIMPL domain-containing protein [Streptomyces sp. 4N509B]|uniref:SIMPL domain-containing protein n=1 Tax=Streptomyces sp. 4N509B TaxID=3457413 RepID=UPI003FD10808